MAAADLNAVMPRGRGSQIAEALIVGPLCAKWRPLRWTQRKSTPAEASASTFSFGPGLPARIVSERAREAQERGQH